MSLPPRAQEIPTMGIRSILFLSNLLSKVATLSLPKFWKASNWITGTLSPSIITLTTNIGLQILRFMKDKQLRMHLPRMFSLIENILWLSMLPFFFLSIGWCGKSRIFPFLSSPVFFHVFFLSTWTVHFIDPNFIVLSFDTILLIRASNPSHLLGEGCYLNHPISWEKGAIKTRVASACVGSSKMACFFYVVAHDIMVSPDQLNWIVHLSKCNSLHYNSWLDRSMYIPLHLLSRLRAEEKTRLRKRKKSSPSPRSKRVENSGC